MISKNNNLKTILMHFRWKSQSNVHPAFLLVLSSIILLVGTNAQAMPSFARQTGAACSQCHTQSFGPNLTPFGRDFKLGGYTMGGGSGVALLLNCRHSVAWSWDHSPIPKKIRQYKAQINRMQLSGLPIALITT
jgi:hypothetical protein